MDLGFTRYQGIASIIGDIVNLRIGDTQKMQIPPRNRDLAIIEQEGEFFSLAQIIKLSDDLVSLQSFSGIKGWFNNFLFNKSPTQRDFFTPRLPSPL